MPPNPNNVLAAALLGVLNPESIKSIEYLETGNGSYWLVTFTDPAKDKKTIWVVQPK